MYLSILTILILNTLVAVILFKAKAIDTINFTSFKQVNISWKQRAIYKFHHNTVYVEQDEDEE